MAFRRCDAGEHTYDDSKTSSCPFCRSTRLQRVPEGPPLDIPPPQPPIVGSGGTIKVSDNNGTDNRNDGKTRRVEPEGFDTGNSSKKSNSTGPVVGWLVIVNGMGKGCDLRIVSGMNNIGRIEGEIVLNFGDNSISKKITPEYPIPIKKILSY